jgi:hypothetical protein
MIAHAQGWRIVSTRASSVAMVKYPCKNNGAGYHADRVLDVFDREVRAHARHTAAIHFGRRLQDPPM